MTNGTNNKSTASGKGGNWREKLGISASGRKREGDAPAPGGDNAVSPSSRERLTGGIATGKAASATLGKSPAQPSGNTPKKPVVRPAPLAPRRPSAGSKTTPTPQSAGKAQMRPAAPAGQGRTGMPGRPPMPPRPPFGAPGAAGTPGGQGASAEGGRLRPPPPPPGMRPASTGGRPKGVPRPSAPTPSSSSPATAADDDFARRLRAQREAAERLAAQRAAAAGRPPFAGATSAGTAGGAAVPPISPRPAGKPAVSGNVSGGAQPVTPPAAPGTPGPGAAGRPPFTFADTDVPMGTGGPVSSPGAAPATSVHARHPDPAVTEEGMPPYRPESGLEDVFEEDFAPEARRAAPEDYASAYSEFGEDFAEPPRRRGLGLLLFVMALLIVVAVALGVVYFYQRLGGGAAPAGSSSVPVIKPQQTPVKVKPKEQPAPARPKGRKQIYDRILGDGEEQPARIVPSEEKPLPPPGPPAGTAPDTGGGTGTEVDPLPLPLPPPPALDGGQGQMDGNGGTADTAEVAPAGENATGVEKVVSLDTPAAAEPPQPHSDTTAAAPDTGMAPAADARTVASTTAADVANDTAAGSVATAEKIIRKKIGANAAAAGNVTTDARERKRKTAKQTVLRKRKVVEAAGKRVRRRTVARAVDAGGPKSLIPPVALTPEVRAFASPAVPRSQVPVNIAPQKPVKVTNFATHRRITNFGTGKPTVPEAVTSKTPAAPVRVARNTQAPARPAIPARNVAAAKGYVVQLASYRSREDALREYQRMRARHAALLGGLPPRIEKKDLGAAGVFYRLAVGPLPSRDQARKLCNALIARGERDCLVRRR